MNTFKDAKHTLILISSVSHSLGNTWPSSAESSTYHSPYLGSLKTPKIMEDLTRNSMQFLLLSISTSKQLNIDECFPKKSQIKYEVGIILVNGS